MLQDEANLVKVMHYYTTHPFGVIFNKVDDLLDF